MEEPGQMSRTDPETIGQSLDTAVIKCTVRDEPERRRCRSPLEPPAWGARAIPHARPGSPLGWATAMGNWDRGTYAVEEWTAQEGEILRRYFTNLDGPVFALVNLPEVVKGALRTVIETVKSKLKSLPCEDAQGNVHPIRLRYACSLASGARDTAQSMTSWLARWTANPSNPSAIAEQAGHPAV